MPMPSREVTASVLAWPQAERDALLLEMIGQLGFEHRLPFGNVEGGASINRQEISRKLFECLSAWKQSLATANTSK